MNNPNNTNGPKLLIDRELLQAVLNYLAEQPFKNVYQLIVGLQRLESLPQRKELEE